jgi:hypothetical protein
LDHRDACVETIQPVIHNFEVLVRFRSKALELFVHKTNHFAQAVETIIDGFETNVDMPEAFVERADQRFETTIDSGEQLLIRHELKLPRSQHTVKKIYSA